MAVVVRVADLVGLPSTADYSAEKVVFELPTVTPPVWKLWGLVLWMAARDGAWSIHYHPWRDGDSLAYVLDGKWVMMVPPPVGVADEIVKVARTQFIRPARGWFGRPATGPACGSFELDVWGEWSLWDAVVWATEGRCGVELCRSTPIPDRRKTETKTASGGEVSDGEGI